MKPSELTEADAARHPFLWLAYWLHQIEQRGDANPYAIGELARLGIERYRYPTRGY